MNNSPPTCAGCDSDDMLCSCVESMNATYHRTLDEKAGRLTIKLDIDTTILDRFVNGMLDANTAANAGPNLPCPEDCGERNTTASSEPNHCYLAEMTRC